MHSTTRRAERPRHLIASILAVGLLAPLLLSGCGGGSGVNGTSTSDQGFRIVPAGGTVIPLSDTNNNPLVVFSTQANVVNSGVQVSATATTTTSFPVLSGGNKFPVPGVGGNTFPVLGGGYSVSVSPDNPAINVPISLKLAYTAVPKDAQGNLLDPATTFRIYYLPPGGTQAQWIALPNNTVSLAASGIPGTVTATIATVPPGASAQSLPGFLKSGTYAIFATAAPSPPPL